MPRIFSSRARRPCNHLNSCRTTDTLSWPHLGGATHSRRKACTATWPCSKRQLAAILLGDKAPNA